jgi:coenzyme F420 hydrogenase subunit beta
MLSFFCAGVPSHRGAEEVLEQLNVDLAELASFRYRGNGWPGHATATKTDGIVASMSYEQSWGDVLARHVQLRCRICPDGVGSFADVACADAWETDEGGSPLFDERDGMSFILTRTSRGEALVRSAMATGRLRAQPAGLGELAAIQPGQYSKAVTGPARLWALRVLGRPTPRFRGFSSLRRVRRAGLRTAGRQFFGTLKRAATGRLNY